MPTAVSRSAAIPLFVRYSNTLLARAAESVLFFFCAEVYSASLDPAAEVVEPR